MRHASRDACATFRRLRRFPTAAFAATWRVHPCSRNRTSRDCRERQDKLRTFPHPHSGAIGMKRRMATARVVRTRDCWDPAVALAGTGSRASREQGCTRHFPTAPPRSRSNVAQASLLAKSHVPGLSRAPGQTPHIPASARRRHRNEAPHGNCVDCADVGLLEAGHGACENREPCVSRAGMLAPLPDGSAVFRQPLSQRRGASIPACETARPRAIASATAGSGDSRSRTLAALESGAARQLRGCCECGVVGTRPWRWREPVAVHIASRDARATILEVDSATFPGVI